MSYKKKSLRSLMNYFVVLILLSGGMLLTSCNEQARGFALPEGDIEKGVMTYKKLACNECHSISNIEWKGGKDNLRIELGGEVGTQKTYGDLVTSVINPSHRVAPRYREKTSAQGDLSKMKNYNEVLTVEELINLVAFLQSEYHIVSPPTRYTPYGY